MASDSIFKRVLDTLGLSGDAIPRRGQTVEKTVSVPARDSSASKLFGSYGGSNPAEYNRTVTAKQSHSDALGIVFGQDRELYDLYAEMRDKDATIAMACAHLLAIANEFPSGFVADDAEDEEAGEIVKACEECLVGTRGNFGWQGMLDALALGAFVDGFAVVQTAWTVREGRISPDWFRQEHPSLFSFTDTGAPVLAIGGYKLADPRRFVVSRWGAPYGNPFGESQLHGLRWLYDFKRSAMRGWLAYTEKYGLPILVAKVPPDATDGATTIANLRSAIQSLDLTNGLILAQGETIESIARDGGKGGSQSHQEAFIKHMDANILRRILAGELNVASGASVGSYAQSQTHDANTRRRAVAMVRMRDEAVNRGPVAAFVEMNFGPHWVGRVRFLADTETKADTGESIARLDAAFRLGVEVRAAQAREMLGMERPLDDDEILVPPVAAAPPPFGSEVDPGGGEGEDEGEEPKFRDGPWPWRK